MILRVPYCYPKNKENNKKALELAYEILEIDNKASKWVARGAIRELESEKVQSKFKKS